MKLALITTIWKRHELTKIVLNYYLQYKQKYNLELICVGSEGIKSKRLAKGWHYIEHENYPVSNKHNKALEKAKKLKVDGIILIGSDDLMSEELFQFYQTLTPNENVVHGFVDSHIFDTNTGNLIYLERHLEAQTVGTGRFFSKYILDLCDWELWSDGLNKGLDTNCTNNLKNICIFEQKYRLKDINGFFVDVKHTENITPAYLFENLPIIDKSIMAKKLGKKVAEEIEELHKPEAVEQNDVQEFEKSKMYKFVSNGKAKTLPAGTYEITGEMATQFVKKGYGVVN